MLVFKWNNKYKTHIDSIDEQHRKLINMINDLGKNIQPNKFTPQKQINQLFNNIIEHANEHFDNEEKQMEYWNLDQRHIIAHKRSHQIFLKEAKKLFDGINNNSINHEVLFHFLSSYLSIHILGMDKILAKQIQTIKSGKSPKQAYQTIHCDTENTNGQLLLAVNRLFARTMNINNKILELNKSLEKQVKLRIKELEQSNNILKTMALTDTLTKLGNRRAAIAYLRNEWKKPYNKDTKLTCIMLDADKLKYINDTEGHEAGDRILQILANTIKNSIRNDDFVCRLGGDEFVILSNNTTLKYILKLAEHVRKQVELIKLHFKHQCWNGSISLGVAARDATMSNYVDLLKTADDGLYIAKRNGRNMVACIQHQ